MNILYFLLGCLIGIIIFIICGIIWIILKNAFFPHREVWDDIKDIKTQKQLNKMRKRYGLKQKKINYKTGAIK